MIIIHLINYHQNHENSYNQGPREGLVSWRMSVDRRAVCQRELYRSQREFYRSQRELFRSQREFASLKNENKALLEKQGALLELLQMDVDHVKTWNTHWGN